MRGSDWSSFTPVSMGLNADLRSSVLHVCAGCFARVSAAIAKVCQMFHLTSAMNSVDYLSETSPSWPLRAGLLKSLLMLGQEVALRH